MDTWIWIVLVIIGLFVWNRLSARKFSRSPTLDGHIEAGGTYSFEVVGERSYQENLKLICGSPNFEGYSLEKTAILVLEDDNPYDNQAVRVSIDNLTVGYLPRALARDYRNRLSEAGKPYALYSCAALIRGGWNRGKGDKGPFGVLPDLPRNR